MSERIIEPNRRFAVVFEVDNFLYNVPKEDFLQHVRNEIEYGTKDLLTFAEEEYDKRNPKNGK